jgi:hypothetical protein
MSLPWEICFFFRSIGVNLPSDRQCHEAKRETAEVSRSHSSEETFVMKAERRAESLKQGSFFFEVVKATG